MSFKIAYGAGHYMWTAGKRLPKALDANETREWELNDRVARHFADAAAQYENVELLRVDDATGNTEVTLQTRCAAANKWGADMCLAIHHNAGVKLGKGGGIVAYAYKEGTKAAEYRDAIYAACIAAGGLKGNRSKPLQTANFYVLMYTKAPAVLCEYGFMDSTADAPVILTDAYSKLVAYATMDGIAKAAGLKKKAVIVDKPKEGYTQEQFIRDVQKAIGAGVDGIAGPETLGKTVTVSSWWNRKHAVVKPMQKRLYALGYTEVGEADGVAGSKFTKALKRFQKEVVGTKLPDGIATAKNKTWRKLLGMP